MIFGSGEAHLHKNINLGHRTVENAVFSPIYAYRLYVIKLNLSVKMQINGV